MISSHEPVNVRSSERSRMDGFSADEALYEQVTPHSSNQANSARNNSARNNSNQTYHSRYELYGDNHCTSIENDRIRYQNDYDEPEYSASSGAQSAENSPGNISDPTLFDIHRNNMLRRSQKHGTRDKRKIPRFLNISSPDYHGSIHQHALMGHEKPMSIPQVSVCREESQSMRQSVLVSRNNTCMACNEPIPSNDRVARTEHGTVHLRCFRCAECNCHLEHSQLYYSAQTNAFYCHVDYHELFSDKCAHCNTPIEGKGMFAMNNNWHIGHFFCSECSKPFEETDEYLTIKDLPVCSECYISKTAPNCWKCNHALVGSQQEIEALGRIWCSTCFACEECAIPFDDCQFILRQDGTLVCESCEQRRIKTAIWGKAD